MGIRSLLRRSSVLGSASAAVAPIYVDSDDNRVKLIAAGSGSTTEIILQEANGAALSEVVITTKTVTAAESGKTFFLALAVGFTTALPAPAVGLRYRFHVQIAPTGGAGYTVTAATLAGRVFSVVAGDADNQNTTAGVNIIFVNDVSLIGDSAEFFSDGTSWFVWAISNADAGITIN